ncbi:sporulation protein [Adhaeribacter soli]|uniref:Sporulation protein n=1 Tax=Adhaeribacter soli TaxID=2607655 RepID=A0A5N1IUX7_9BACT|nr:sporulation protein [Adhaeribacter soli]KAA9333731.1 sporulation protein [Adhaeribacter soli]
MRKQYQILALTLLLTIFSACAGSKATGTSGNAKTSGAKTVAAGAKKSRTEDLSAYRPKVAAVPENLTASASVMPTHHVNEKVASLLDTVANANKNIKYAQGYRILAYTGNDRKTAFDLRKAIIGQMPEERDYLTYVQPTFKLKIGDFYSRMEANQALQQIRNIVPNASIIAEQVNVNRPR